MDPNVTLQEILQICVDIAERDDCDSKGGCYDYEVIELVNAIDNLHGWLSKGGFLPEAWNKNRGGS